MFKIQTDIEDPGFAELYENLDEQTRRETGIQFMANKFGAWLIFWKFGEHEKGTGAAAIVLRPAGYEESPGSYFHVTNILGVSNPLPFELLKKVLTGKDGLPVSPAAAEIMEAAGPIYEIYGEIQERFPLVARYLPAATIGRFIRQRPTSGRPYPDYDALREATQYIKQRLPKIAQLEPGEKEKGILLKLHEKLKALSLWQNLTGDYNEAADYANDLGFRRHEDTYQRSFEQKAEASAVQLAIARMTGLVAANVSSTAWKVQQLPREIRPYYGFTDKDEGRAMAFMSGEAGRFESSISRQVVREPEYLEDAVAKYAKELLPPEEASHIAAWWSRQFGKEPEQTPTAAPVIS